MKNNFNHFLGGIKGAFTVIFAFLLFPFARLFLWHKKIWIVSEFGYEARDNGYSFFKYMRKEHPEVNCYYTIDFKSSDYSKIKALGNAIKFGSFRHLLYWCAARYIISSKTQGFCPSYYLTLLRKRVHLWGKYVFLQHGITKDDQKFLYKKPSKIDLFICGAKPEYDDIKAHYGYKDNEVAYTGFARFDAYFNTTPNKQIFVMPTWRRYVENINITDTDYYRVWLAFINSKSLNILLQNNDVVLYFYLHPHFKDYVSLFKSKSSNIKVLPFDQSDIQVLIKESSLFITDFSSLAFDFAYMKRPLVYYQYDEEEYFKGHYIKGYFDYRKDGFGEVCNTLNQVEELIALYIKNSFIMEEKYLNKVNVFFPLHDANNSERIYNSISTIYRKQTK